MKIHPVVVRLFHMDTQTDTTKLMVPFHNLVNTHKKIAFAQPERQYGCHNPEGSTAIYESE